MNSIILKPGSPVQQRLQKAATQWIASGRPAEHLLSRNSFFPRPVLVVLKRRTQTGERALPR